MRTTYELNNLRKDDNYLSNKIKKTSPVSEVFAAMVNGKELSEIDRKYGKKVSDPAVKYIKQLGNRAENGDYIAVAELNTLRRFVVETPLLEEIKMLSIFGSYTSCGYDETIEREVYKHVGEKSRTQATNGDVVFPTISKEVYQVPTFTVSGGYAIDYRRVSLGDMTKENEGMEQVRIDIRNRAIRAIILKTYESVKNAVGIKYMVEAAGLTKSAVDDALAKIRRFGKPTVLGDYALLTQFTPWAGYTGKIDSNTITGISDDIMNELSRNGLLGLYNGAILSEMPNPYDVTSINEDGDDFETILPAGLGYIIPAGKRSPIATYTRGGLTSFTGNNVKTGKVETRFDLEVGCDVAKGLEYQIGIIYDTNIGGLGD